ncbi:MAG: TonB-dependent receptor [Cyclobacteriaceae bacterium]
MRRILLMAFFVSAAFMGAMAQGVTTSTLSGTIKDQNNGAVPGANIVVTHEPSGTVYGTMSQADGGFRIPNMRTGGPYTVKVSFIGYADQTFGGIYLRLGETYSISSILTEEATQLAEIVVSDAEDKVMNSTRNGAVTNVSTRELLSMPTITRSINDMARFTPQASSTSQGAIGGGNYRQNYITVDGSDFNNTFGIGTNLPANGSPISLDALEEISVNITPYDIRQSGFIGSSMNAVTRSGTNEFSGSAYTFWRNENQQGNQVAHNDEFDRQPLQDNTFGFRLGGPILKNKLFFFVNYERGKRTAPGQQNLAATTDAPYGSSPNIARPTRDQLDLISTFLKDNFDYETGPYDKYDFVSDNSRFVARLDWNINENHRFNIRYSSVESKAPSFISSSTSGAGFNYPTGQGRTNINALWFKNSNYYQEANFYSLAAEMNSIFAGKYANTFRATWTHQLDPRSTDSKEFPLVDIMEAGTPYTSFGYEPFTYGNLRDVTSYSIVDYVTRTVGMHTLTGGIQFDFQTTKNGFQRFGTGFYRFNSWADFEDSATGGPTLPNDYAITYSLLPGYKQAYPRVSFAQYSVYAQDEMAISNNFNVTVGVRFDLPTFPSVPEIKTHPLVADLEFQDGRKIDTGVMPETRVLFSPRVGFNWDVKGDRSLQVRGGTGVFTGRVPTVWIVAQSGDAGLLQITQSYNGSGNVPGPFQVAPYRPATPPEPGTTIGSTLSAIDPDFKFPQTWKTSMAVDAKLPGGIIGTLEGIFNKDLNVAIGKNYNLVDPQPLNVVNGSGVAYPDNRVIYPSQSRDRSINGLLAGQAVPTGTAGSSQWNPIVLGNTSNKGYYFSITAKLDKQFDNGLSAFIAYTRTESEVIYDGIGDQLFNTWSLTPISGEANSPGLSYAGYTVPDRMIAGISFRKEYLKKLATTVSVFYEGSIQGRFSYTYSADFNRDGQTNDLIYVPKDASEITFQDQTYAGVLYTAAQQSAMFFKYIEQDKYLSSRKGKYAERNGGTLPWRNQVDVRIAQDIFTNIGGKKNTLQFTLDIFNFGNAINSSWGVFKTVNAPSILQPRNVSSLVPGGNTLPTFSLANDRGAPVTSTFRDNNSIVSTYYMQFGLRYIFN